MEMACTRDAYGAALLELGEKYPNMVVLSADLAKSTKTDLFGKKFPTRFFNMGVAEANMINTAAGLAAAGKIAFASTFAIFAAGRAWEQIRNTIGYGRLNVKIVVTHGGIQVGGDGSSHQAIEDIALMRVIPGMTVLVPVDALETRKAIFAAAAMNGPVYVRLARSKAPVITKPDDKFEIGKGLVLREGADVTIFACGLLAAHAIEAADSLKAEGIAAAVCDLASVKPIDEELIVRLAGASGAAVTAEEHVVEGGFGSAVCEVLARRLPVPVEMVGIRNRFGQSGEPPELYKEYGLTAADIAAAAKKAIQRKRG
jgi:transketolase